MKDRTGGWKPEVVPTGALSGEGIGQLAGEILRHKEFLVTSGELEKRRRERARLELTMALESSLKSYMEKMDTATLENLITDLTNRKTNPKDVAEKMIQRL